MTFATDTLETVIKSSGVQMGPPSSSGWHPVNCRVCSDYKPRGGFLFDGGNVAYKCFNCGIVALHKPTSRKISEKMFEVLVAFGVDIHSVKRTLFTNFASPVDETPEELQYRASLLPPAPIEVPDEFQFITASNPAHAPTIDYATSRCIDYAKYGLMLSSTTNEHSKWYNRIIVPSYDRSNRVIFYQGRYIGPHKKRWESPPLPKANVIFGYHNLDDYSTKHIIVCEGAFDAMSIDGVAILGSELTPFQIKVLNQSSKTKIVVPQRDENGKHMALQALEQGYSLSFPDIGRAQDINDAVQQYGRLYTEQQILSKQTSSKYTAQLKLGMWCSL